MNTVSINLDTLTPELRERFGRFEADKCDYVNQQNSLVSLDAEVSRLRWKATTVVSTARNAEIAYRKLASTPGVDQTQISAEIVRVNELKVEAEALTVTANAQAESRGRYIIQLAEMRNRLKNEPSSIDQTYRAQRLERLLQREDMREYLLEIFGLCRSNDDSAWPTFIQSLKKLFDGAELVITAPALAVLPIPVKGEVVVSSPVQMLKLKRECS